MSRVDTLKYLRYLKVILYVASRATTGHRGSSASINKYKKEKEREKKDLNLLIEKSEVNKITDTATYVLRGTDKQINAHNIVNTIAYMFSIALALGCSYDFAFLIHK